MSCFQLAIPPLNAPNRASTSPDMASNRYRSIKADTELSEMAASKDVRSTSFVFPVAEKADPVGRSMRLTRADLQNLPQVIKQVLGVCDFLPAALQSDILLDGGRLLVQVGPSPSAPMPLTPDEIHAICVNALNVLSGTAADITRNAERPEPRPLTVVSPNRHALTLLRSLSSGSEGIRPPAILQSQGNEYPLPVLPPADFTSTDTEATQRKQGEFRIIGLIRDEDQGRYQFVLVGGLRVELPKSPKWSWPQIHDVLDFTAYLVGTLIRESAGDAWTVSDDTHVERQPPLF